MWEPEIAKVVFVKGGGTWVPLKSEDPNPMAGRWKERWMATVCDEGGNRRYVVSSLSYFTSSMRDFACPFLTRRGAVNAARAAAQNHNSFEGSRNPTWEKV